MFAATRPPTSKKVILVSGSYERAKKIHKSQFITLFIGIEVTIKVSQLGNEIFATQCFFTDHLKNKIVNKTTCRIPSTNSRQL